MSNVYALWYLTIVTFGSIFSVQEVTYCAPCAVPLSIDFIYKILNQWLFLPANERNVHPYLPTEK